MTRKIFARILYHMKNTDGISSTKPQLKVEKSGSLMEHTIQEIQQYMIKHRLEPGDRIPTERGLAEQIGVSRTVIRDALKTLSAFGVLEIRDRVGTFVANVGTERIGQGLSSRLYVNRESMESLLEVRQTLEKTTSELAAQKCDSAGQERLKTILFMNREAAENGDLRQFRKSDKLLHIAIAEIADNAIILDLLQGVFKYLVSFGLFIEGHTIFMDKCSIEHQRITEAIVQKDHAGARKAMGLHLDSVHSHLLEHLEILNEK